MVTRSVIVLSAQHCGCSFLGAIISEAHRRIYNELAYWNYEISRMIAVDPKYCLPMGYSSVYYVKLKWLLKRPYDKIIVLKLNWEEWLESMYNRYGRRDDPDYFKQLKFYYDLVYDYETSDPRVQEFNWYDLNNYTVATYSDLFDFLEFKFDFRPFLIPSFRDPRLFGSILCRGHEEGALPKQHAQYVNEERLNPYKIAPEEYIHQEARVFRLNGMKDALEIEGWIKK